ncbi:MAG TPA: S8 family serine peptidase [Thermoanaerobaculia bacterium]
MRLLVLLLLVALPLRAERVRVVVAADARQEVIDALQTATNIEPWGDSPAFVAEMDVAEAARLQRDPRVRAVSLDTGGGGGLAQSIPIIGANVTRAQGIDGRGRTIAILDSGVDRMHPDLAGRVVAEQCFCDNFDSGCCPGGGVAQSGIGAADDDNGHGTHVAGIAAGAGIVAPPGVAPAANIVAVKVLDAANRFRGFTQIYRALEWIADTRPDVDVVNMSLGSDALFTDQQCSTAAFTFGFAHVVHRLRARGVLIAASTGNTSSSTSTWMPACIQDVLGVGATWDFAGDHCGVQSNTPDEVVCQSNSSSSMDIVAPGWWIVSSRRGGGTVQFAGTSMSAPHVAGTILLMKQVGGRSLHADLIEDILKRTGVPAFDKRNGLTFPRLDALAAVNATPRAPNAPRRRATRR